LQENLKNVLTSNQCSGKIKLENMFEVILMIILNRYKVTDINKFKRFMFFTILFISICIFSLIFTIKVYSKDIPQYKYISVKEGDTLWSIASSYAHNGDIRELIYKISIENNIQNASIFPGDIVKISLNTIK